MKSELRMRAKEIEEQLEQNKAVKAETMLEKGYVLGRFADTLRDYYYRYEIRMNPVSTPESLKWNHKILLKLNSQGKSLDNLFGLLHQTFRRNLKDLPYLHEEGQEYLRALVESAYTISADFKGEKFDKTFEEAFIYGLNR